MDRRSFLMSVLALPTIQVGLSAPCSLSSFASTTKNFGGPLLPGLTLDAERVEATRELFSILHRLANNVDVEQIWDGWFGWDDRAEWDAEKMFCSLLHETAIYPELTPQQVPEMLAHLRARPDLLDHPMTISGYSVEESDESCGDEVYGVSIGDVVLLLNDSRERWSYKTGEHSFEAGI
jgi:hypothetical protein